MEVQGTVIPIDVIDVYLRHRVIGILSQRGLEIKSGSISECDRAVNNQTKKHTIANDNSALVGCTAASNASRRMLVGGASTESLFFFCDLHFFGSALFGAALRFCARPCLSGVKSIHLILGPVADAEDLEVSGAPRLAPRSRLRDSVAAVAADLLAVRFIAWKK